MTCLWVYEIHQPGVRLDGPAVTEEGGPEGGTRKGGKGC
jgi:hypothetical protein